MAGTNGLHDRRDHSTLIEEPTPLLSPLPSGGRPQSIGMEVMAFVATNSN